MAQVSVKVNGYVYNVGCEDGQEPHLLAMSQQVESRIDSIKALGGITGETQLLLLASLLMADEIHDLKIELETLRSLGPKAARAKAADGEKKSDPELGRRLGRLAVRAEQIADGLEHP
jgi:cell division protein ZapA